ncbi:MAG: hypothetical protein ACXIUQ_20250 [Cecembia sp.]
MQKARNVTKFRKIILSISMFFVLSISNGQDVENYHNILNEIFKSEGKEKTNLLDKVDLSSDWIDYLEDSVFVSTTLRYSCNKESVGDLIKQIDLIKARETIENTSDFTWQKRKLNSNFKLQKKVAQRGLTYQYSIPIKEKKIVIVRIKSFDSYNNTIGDYIYFMKKNPNEVWDIACILVIEEMFPDYKL